jgi:hypothetical protein
MSLSSSTSTLRPFAKDTLIKGVPSRISCLEINGQTYAVTRGAVTVVGLEDDWYADEADPESVIDVLRRHREFTPDLFTFWQRWPDVVPRHRYHQEWEEIAVLPLRSYEHWWSHQIKSRVRNQIRKAEKDGVVVKETAYDDEFVRGLTRIFNEAPVRQGRRFWHYGKDIETVRVQFSRYLYRERMIGAYYHDVLIGFIMLGNAGRFGLTGQIISSLEHRDKPINNALVAKAVSLCEQDGLEALIYLFWSDDSLSEFKRRCGFERVRMPRFYVPLTRKGELALTLGMHRGWKRMLPPRIKTPLKRLREIWLERTCRA